jgi:hypothetical protein
MYGGRFFRSNTIYIKGMEKIKKLKKWKKRKMPRRRAAFLRMDAGNLYVRKQLPYTEASLESGQ